MAKIKIERPADIKASGSPVNIDRRRFMSNSVALGAAAGALGLGISPAIGYAAPRKPTRAG